MEQISSIKLGLMGTLGVIGSIIASALGGGYSLGYIDRIYGC
jgi:hypothetical protein